MVKSRITTKTKETEGGIIAVTAEVEKQIEHGVKDGGKDTYVVVNELGEDVRVYKKEPGCDDPKAAAESYARKMGLKWV
jgi:hypothetical protein